MNGFKNCRSVTEFKVGMRIAWGGEWHRVVLVDEQGRAHCLPDNAEIAAEHLPWFWPMSIKEITLDLDSIWVGREYRHKGDRDLTALILLVGGGYVCYRRNDREAYDTVDGFLAVNEPLPLAEAKPPEQHTDSLTITSAGVSLNLSPMEYRDGKGIRLVCKGVDNREHHMRLDRADAKRLMDYLAVQLAMGGGSLSLRTRPSPPQTTTQAEQYRKWRPATKCRLTTRTTIRSITAGVICG